MRKFELGQAVRKKSGSSWHGRVVGTYSTALTPMGYCIESYYETGSVQIYPEAAIESWIPPEAEELRVSGVPYAVSREKLHRP